ncbi:protein phosphatase 2C domain-containing protein [Herbaspirillum sp. LeCh32-8]|uniref:PP2C family serine/threonine-protein phosphatase n=1 Tax=Herbaspirillum sp. LeCh32-8 TaxID=2821356 RepID=UPI001AE8DBBF|nr:protein phosphatase 2C domain-containing protein [Herbaspirillum sp. LeCh32-8]
MSWRVVAASEVGTSHAHTNTPCQDSCWAQVYELSPGIPLLSIFVADGAGSASRGGEGAELAIQGAVDYLTTKLAQREFGLNDRLATDLILSIRDRIFRAADAEKLTGRDFSCTFLGLLSSPLGTLAFQIGDGGIVIDVGQGLELAIVPMSGEYANMTSFITDENAVEVLITKTYANAVSLAAVFSDGIQRIALNLATNMPHEPFFAPFFKTLKVATEEQEDQLQVLLAKFLSGPAVNERTDDDKTLALAVQST